MNNENILVKSTEHWYGFDLIKGILIVFVFMGHVIPGVLRSTFPRYAIYSFHMPLFVGISGFLLNVEKIDIGFSKLFAKYWKRLILPWMIAVSVFFFTQNLMDGKILDITMVSFAAAFCYPYYHLWYIMGFICYILVFRFLWIIFKNVRFKWTYIFIIAACLSAISKWDCLSGHISNMYLNILYKIIQNDFRLRNLIFFVFGIYCRYIYEHFGKPVFDKFIDAARVCMGLSIIFVTILFYFSYQNVENIMFYVMNICILFVIFYDCIASCLPRSKVFEFMGKYSLPVYLYHVLGKLFAVYLFEEGTEGYYIVNYN
jgi:acyltransferase